MIKEFIYHKITKEFIEINNIDIGRNGEEITIPLGKNELATRKDPQDILKRTKEGELLIYINDGWQIKTQEWFMKKFYLAGSYFIKENGEKKELEEVIKNDNTLTKVEALKSFDDGTTQKFNEELQKWEYTFKGKELLDLEKQEEIEEAERLLMLAKNAKMVELREAYNKSKKITIKNGNTLEINHDTKEGDFLLKIIEEVNNIQEVSLGAYIYTQQNANMGFRIMPEIAKYIFKDMFVSALSNGTKVNSRVHNRAVIFENNKHKIEKANSINELNTINWSFINPNGVIVDINKKADQILADANTSEEVKTTINFLKDENGEIHLIKPISELE